MTDGYTECIINHTISVPVTLIGIIERICERKEITFDKWIRKALIHFIFYTEQTQKGWDATLSNEDIVILKCLQFPTNSKTDIYFRQHARDLYTPQRKKRESTETRRKFPSRKAQI